MANRSPPTAGWAKKEIARVADAADLHLRDYQAPIARDWGRDSRHRSFHDLVRGWPPLAKILVALERHTVRRSRGEAFHAPADRQPPAHPGPCRAYAARAPEDEAKLAGLIAPLCGSRAALLAASLLETYGSLPALLRSSPAALTRALPAEAELVALLLAIRPLIRELLRVEMLDGPALPDNQAALDYLFVTLAHETAEQVRMLYLDAKNRILAQEIVSQGSVTRADVFPREILRRALEIGATGLIMAHNHPSGDPQPSRSDLQATRAVAEAARLFDIHLHDHIIIGRSGCLSLRGAGYL